MKQLISDAETTITHIQEDSSKVADDNDRATLEEELALYKVNETEN
jgi:DnaK suppressor protein